MTKVFVLSPFVLFVPREATQGPVPGHVVPTGPQSEMTFSQVPGTCRRGSQFCLGPRGGLEDRGPSEWVVKNGGSSQSGWRGIEGAPKQEMQKARDTRAFGSSPEWVWDQATSEDEMIRAMER